MSDLVLLCSSWRSLCWLVLCLGSCWPPWLWGPCPPLPLEVRWSPGLEDRWFQPAIGPAGLPARLLSILGWSTCWSLQWLHGPKACWRWLNGGCCSVFLPTCLCWPSGECVSRDRDDHCLAGWCAGALFALMPLFEFSDGSDWVRFSGNSRKQWDYKMCLNSHYTNDIYGFTRAVRQGKLYCFVLLQNKILCSKDQSGNIPHLFFQVYTQFQRERIGAIQDVILLLQQLCCYISKHHI